ncbi:hypothetical protein ACFVHB_30385 [Kitasatospora sp. NPDC127111]|uniref:hypothetical protein n=1 Tax=Kitasatospora sp. NPDC127111 TaxID=3345363 RepID=UPI0036264DDD
MAPTEALWNTFVAEARTVPLDGRPVLAALQEALFTALDRMAEEERTTEAGGPTDTWARRTLRSRRLAVDTPSMDAHGLRFCDRTIATAEEVLHGRLGLPAGARELRLRLALDLLVAAFHAALSAWVLADGHPPHPGAGPSRAALAEELRTAFAAIPGSLTFAG